VSILLKIPSLFRRRHSILRRKALVRRNNGEKKSPKNGRLILAVIGAFALMLVLLTVNVRLLRSPTADGQRSTSYDPARSEFSYPARANSASPQGKACTDPPVVMDERQGNSANEQNPQRHDQITSSMKAGKETSSPKFMQDLQAPKSSVPPEPSSVAKKAEIKKSPESQAQKSSQPSDKSPKRYTVQVGAFTNPQMAEEQALHWKSLGYKTILRPAAMPKAGIVYRLYLGSFQSEKEAESLVRDLKAKGVSSFSAVVSN
jgi:cell division septation protein DedD